MIVRVTLPHSALTPSGTGKECYKITPLKVKGMFNLRLRTDTDRHGVIDIVMDERTAANLWRDMREVVK